MLKNKIHTTILENKYEIHDTIREIVTRVEETNTSTEKNELMIVSCHGPDHISIGLSSVLKHIFFELAGCDAWNFQEATGIYSHQRLDEKIGQCKKLSDAKSFSLKAFITVNGPTIITPLIIGNNDVLLGIDHENDNTPNKAIHIQGIEHVNFFKSYITSLLKKRNAYTLRDENGIRLDQVSLIRNALSRTLNLKEDEDK